MRVLIVEDNPDICLFVEAWLADDAEVRIANSAAEVTDVDIDWCSAVLADFMLPDVDGCTVLARVAGRRPGVRRVLWSASTRTAKDCPHAHVVLSKPVALEPLIEALTA